MYALDFQWVGPIGPKNRAFNEVVSSGRLFSGATIPLKVSRKHSLIVSNRGAVFSLYGEVGADSSSRNNRGLVTGSGSIWSNNFSLSIGYDGSGNSLIISNQGAVFNDYGFVGRAGSSSNNT